QKKDERSHYHAQKEHSERERKVHVAGETQKNERPGHQQRSQKGVSVRGVRINPVHSLLLERAFYVALDGGQVNIEAILQELQTGDVAVLRPNFFFECRRRNRLQHVLRNQTCEPRQVLQ